MAETIEERGGVIHYRNTATSITPDGPDHIVVTTDRGLGVHARAVVSNASPLATVGMLPEDLVDESWSSEIRSETPALASFVVYLGLDKDVAAEGWDHHEFFDMGSYDLDALPVVDEQNCLVGLLSLDDILMLLSEEFEEIGRWVGREGPQRAGAVGS